MMKIRIGSRGSDLALWQANHVKRQLEELGAEVSITIIKTQGDKIQDLSFDKLEGKGFFTKEIEEALLNNSIDLAVHSHKDLETTSPEDLVIAAVSEREDPSDVLLVNKRAFDSSQDWNLKENAVVGTSSPRRKSQVMSFRPDAQIKDLRGNVPTRLQRVIDGDYDAILLAKAGLDRLNLDLSAVHVEVLNPLEFVPAPAQGVLALQMRSDAGEMLDFVKQLHHTEVAAKIAMERKVLNQMQGGCQLPLGVYCPEEGKLLVAYTSDWENGADFFEFEGPHDEELASIVVETLLEEIEDED